MKRREFITLACAAAAAWPRAAGAQQAGRIRRIVFLHLLSENDPEEIPRVVALRQGLEALGWTEKGNIQIEHRYVGDDFGRIRSYTTEMVTSAPDLIIASGSPITAALKQTTGTIPIVFVVVSDPVGQGFVGSLSRPGGNITGFSFIEPPLIGKWMEMLKEIAPGVRRVTLLFNPDTAPFYPALLRELEAVQAPLTAELSSSPVQSDAEIETAITTFAREGAGGLIAAPDAFINTRRKLIMTLAERHRLPTIYGYRRFVTEGALISYGPNAADIVRRAATYVDRILKGEKPADLPVQAPTKFELVVNLKTAKALGLTVPLIMQMTADEVVE
jgi:ABC-type uncharacterized transport system substrate-binding protein